MYILYWIVGLDDEDFYLPKANYCAEIGWFKAAIRSYRKALHERNDPRIRAAIGWCYAELGMNEKSVKNYRIAYEKDNSPELAIGLAFAEYSVGNLAEFRNIYKKLKSPELKVASEYKEQLKELHKLGENVAKEQTG